MGSWRQGSASARILLVLLFLSPLFGVGKAQLGVCYGRQGNDLPTPPQAVALLQGIGITSVRIFDSDSTVIQAFADSGIDLGITIPNDEVAGIAFSANTSDQWVAANVLPYVPATNISSISVGSEVIFSDSGNSSLLLVPAMVNIYLSLQRSNLATAINVTTSHAMNILSVSYPPSAGTFNDTYVDSVIVPMLRFLSQTRSPLLLNSYPYYAYVADPDGITLSYALFTSNSGIVDSNTNLQYTNLLDAQIDAVLAAMRRVNFTEIPIVVAESGWPSKGDADESAATVTNAKTYNQNLVNHILAGAGTPLAPGYAFSAYVFSLYNEDLKTGPSSERNFGVYNSDGSPVYSLGFGGSDQQRNKTWCVAQGSASNSSLQIGLNYACGTLHVDCKAIQRGGACYEPNTYINHASYAFNEFYQNSNMDIRSCNFSGTATTTTRDPSYGSCGFFARNPSSAQNLWQDFHTRQQAQFCLTVLSALFLLLKLTY